MDPRAARKARRTAIEADLRKAYTDEEACPPEWLDIAAEVSTSAADLREEIAAETERFLSEPDVRVAIGRRDRIDRSVRARIDVLNQKVRRLNLIAPHARFTRTLLDADELLRPLFRSPRPAAD